MNRITMLLLLLSLAGPACADDGGKVDPGVATPAQASAAQATSHPGKRIYDKWCGICHGRGERMPGTASLQAAYEGEIPAALEDRSDLTAEFIEYFVRNGVMIMPAFRKTEISGAELRTLADYLTQQKTP